MKTIQFIINQRVRVGEQQGVIVLPPAYLDCEYHNIVVIEDREGNQFAAHRHDVEILPGFGFLVGEKQK